MFVYDQSSLVINNFPNFRFPPYLRRKIFTNTNTPYVITLKSVYFRYFNLYTKQNNITNKKKKRF